MNGLFESLSHQSDGLIQGIFTEPADTLATAAEQVAPESENHEEAQDIFKLARVIARRANARRPLRRSSSII